MSEDRFEHAPDCPTQRRTPTVEGTVNPDGSVTVTFPSAGCWYGPTFERMDEFTWRRVIPIFSRRGP